LNPKSVKANYELGLAQARTGPKDQGAVEGQKGGQLSVADDRNQKANLDISEGGAALDQGDLDRAAVKFQHATKLQPESGDAQRFLGMDFEKQHDPDGASAAYRRALDLNPGKDSAKQGLDSVENTLLKSARLGAAKRATAGPNDLTKITEFEGYIRETKGILSNRKFGKS